MTRQPSRAQLACTRLQGPEDRNRRLPDCCRPMQLAVALQQIEGYCPVYTSCRRAGAVACVPDAHKAAHCQQARAHSCRPCCCGLALQEAAICQRDSSSHAQQQGTHVPADEGVVEAACSVNLVDVLHSGIAGASNGDASVDGRRTEPSHCLIAAHYQQSCVPAHSSTHVGGSCLSQLTASRAMALTVSKQRSYESSCHETNGCFGAADRQQSSAPACLPAAQVR